MENAGRGAAGWLAKLAGLLPEPAGLLPEPAGLLPEPAGLLPEPAGFLPDLAGFLPRDAHGRSVSPVSDERGLSTPPRPALPRVLILCGPGNNGGDGGVVARHLDAWGFPVRVLWFVRSNQLRGDAAVQWAILQRSRIEQSAWFDVHQREKEIDPASLAALLSDAGWLVDGLLGTGLSRPVDGPLRTVIEAINQSDKPVFALDLPSGLDADTGRPLGVAVRARATATFVAPKLGFAAPEAASYTGEVAVIDIGLPRCLLEPYLNTSAASEPTRRQ
jgi:NAD(P)H-hydrate epimerase